jgi:AMP deaminase
MNGKAPEESANKGEKGLSDMLGRLRTALALRNKYIGISLQGETNEYSPPAGVDVEYIEESGEYVLVGDSCTIPSVEEFYEDVEFISQLIQNGPLKSFCFKRLEHLELEFRMHKNSNAESEKTSQKTESNKDIYTVTKVDTHVHHSACMNSKHLLRFMKHKLRDHPDDVVHSDGESQMTLREVFSSLGKHEGNLCIDSLDTHAHIEAFHRFDRFNSKYNPYGKPLLRNIFLKHDNHIKGAYLAELTRDVIAEMEQREYVASEFGISIYGKSSREWAVLSRWVLGNNLRSDQLRWIIQIPRLYGLFRGYGKVDSFADFLCNIFGPLVKATKSPEAHREKAEFLASVVAFDSVDDESIKIRRSSLELEPPSRWKIQVNPPYQYYLYHVYRNISVVNRYRRSRNMNVFSFRPHSGESGDLEHLVAAFLTAKNIAHGVKLRKSPVLQYMFYLAQVGISMSPLSNNSLFLELRKNPFPQFFARGLRVCLSTDDPLQFHYTREPLMEEYSIASQVWRLSSCDQCELARNSVIVCNFPREKKESWIGALEENGLPVNVPAMTNVPGIRFRYREDVLAQERKAVSEGLSEMNKTPY